MLSRSLASKRSPMASTSTMIGRDFIYTMGVKYEESVMSFSGIPHLHCPALALLPSLYQNQRSAPIRGPSVACLRVLPSAAGGEGHKEQEPQEEAPACVACLRRSAATVPRYRHKRPTRLTRLTPRGRRSSAAPNSNNCVAVRHKRPAQRPKATPSGSWPSA